MTGTLYGVGLGPGDPELMTLKADRLIREAKVVAYPALVEGDSFARSIAAAAIPETAREIRIEVPMTPARAPAQAAYDSAAEDIAQTLSDGHDVVCLCEGDPFFYGSFMYLHARLADRFDVQVVPGVTSMTACAARAARPLVARNEVLTVLPGPLPEDTLYARLEEADTVVIMKVGRHITKIRRVLTHAGLAAQARYLERATLPAERAMPLADAPDPAPYFSMILVTKGADPWL
ncbi:precorrin-2 C(20)-methyltransferase [Tropicimonas sp. S265A]|uniref:precorrin-2 C(20)-methyltransferase n=1 Tax=Tropicimonas sp. S265A TaxID=3415134 RepID=UPI003C79F43E